jgi:pimeloyl-ACP methyl ester carboxylesterase
MLVAGVPILVATPTHVVAPLRTVLWFHGFRADALAHAAELERCASLGFLTVGIDAVGHGARADSNLPARIAAAGGALPVVLDLVDRTIDELSSLVGELVAVHGADRSRVSAVGISMGAFLVYRSIVAGFAWRSAVALLGAPVVSGMKSPHLALQAFASVPLLSITAEHDESVPPGDVRRLHAELDSHDADRERSASMHRHHVLRGSGHLTSAEHWQEAMNETMEWLQRFG